MGECHRAQSRRRWLLRTLWAAITVTVAAILYPVAMFLRPRRGTKSGAMEVVAPYRVNELRPDAAGNWPPPFNFGGKPCLLVLTPDGRVLAFNAICTHLDCTVAYRPEQPDLFCPCHNGVYDLYGQNISGPPPRPLEQYKVTLRGTPGQEEIIVSRSS